MLTFSDLCDRLPGFRPNGSSTRLEFTCPLCQSDEAYVLVKNGKVLTNCANCFQSVSLAETLGLTGEMLTEEPPVDVEKWSEPVQPTPLLRRLTLRQWQDQLIAVAHRAAKTLPEHQKQMPPDVLLEAVMDDLKLGAESLVAYGQAPPEDLVGSAWDEELERAARLGVEAWLGYLVWSAPAKADAAVLAKVEEGPRPLPAPQTANQWFSEEEAHFANTSFIWDGILEAGGLSLITGKKGHGKSTFVRTLSLCLARGVELLGRTTVCSKVWYIDLEPGGRGRIKTWRDMGWTEDDPLYLNTIPPVADHPQKFEWLRENIIKHDFNVVVLDTLFKFLKIEGANDYDKGVYAQVPLEEIARDTGCHFICLHHARKNSMAEGMSVAEVVLGSTSLAGAACACILIHRRATTYTFRMDPPRYGEAVEGELVLEQGNGGWVFAGGNYKKRWIQNAKAELLEVIKTQMQGEFTSQEISFEYSGSLQRTHPKTLAFLLKLLVDDGELTSSGKGIKGNPRRYTLKGTRGFGNSETPMYEKWVSESVKFGNSQKVSESFDSEKSLDNTGEKIRKPGFRYSNDSGIPNPHLCPCGHTADEHVPGLSECTKCGCRSMYRKLYG